VNPTLAYCAYDPAIADRKGTAVMSSAQVPGGNQAGVRKVHWLRSLRTRIALTSGLITLVFMLGVTLATAWYSRQKIVATAQAGTLDTTRAAARGLAENLRTVAVATQQLGRTASAPDLDRQQLRWIQRATTQTVPGVAGTLVALGAREDGQAPYTVYIGDRNRERDFDVGDYDYRVQDWYLRTVGSEQGWWSEPRFSETAGDVWMVTYNVPLRRPAVGMASLDMKLADLVHPMADLGKLPGTEVVLLAPEGTVAYSTIPGLALSGSYADHLARTGADDMRWAVQAARDYRSASRADVAGESRLPRLRVVEPVGNTGWVLVVSQTYGQVIGQFRRALEVLLGASVALTALGMIAVRRLARQISRPVEQLAKSAVQAIAGHDPHALPHQHRRDEVGLLARTLEQARLEIRQQLVEIEQMGAARQKLESELSIARDIQRAMLPDGRTVGLDQDHLEAQALLEPAKAVGGDFYNFIERDGQLWFVIGDVSDKGVPAALFMARTVTMLEVAIQTASSPSQALAEGSRRLVQGNETCMFATVLCGCIDVRSGQLSLASAGHDPPLLVSADGRVQVLELDNGPPLGFEVSESFALWHGTLGPGDWLLAYTDGVTEAFNHANEAYGLERLQSVPAGGLDAAQACSRVLADVQRFADGAPPSDDITILAIQRTGLAEGKGALAHATNAQGDTSVHVSLAQSPLDVLQLTDAIDTLLQRHGVAAPVRDDARLIIEEVASNAVTHAVSEGAPLEMHARVDDARLWLEFRDQGRPFDPTVQAEPDLDADIADRPIGGLGIYMVAQLADGVDYHRVDDCNILRITLRLDAAHDPENTA
jgi:sigma-B regulation protein RsbU (phosphoserine phosphatase)